MKTKYTEGPWSVNTAQKESWNSVGLIVHAPDGSAIAMSGGYSSEECIANAKLIALAPELIKGGQKAIELYNLIEKMHKPEYAAFFIGDSQHDGYQIADMYKPFLKQLAKQIKNI